MTAHSNDLVVIGEFTEMNAAMVRDILLTNGIEACQLGSGAGQPYQLATIKVAVRACDAERAIATLKDYDIGKELQFAAPGSAVPKPSRKQRLTMIIVAIVVVVAYAAYLMLRLNQW